MQREFSSLNLSKDDIAKVVDKAIESSAQALTDVVIQIPQAIIQPIVEIKQGFRDFTLDITHGQTQKFSGLLLDDFNRPRIPFDIQKFKVDNI